jgi:hypothetical protein
MCTAQQYRAKAAEYKERADMACTPDAKREFQELERSFGTLADNEQWLSNNYDKTVHAPALPIAASTLPTTHTFWDVARSARYRIWLKASRAQGRENQKKKEGLMKIVLPMLLFVATASPVTADTRGSRADAAITCETVRAYVSRVGLAAAKAIARANGMTPVQERRARQCLASRD